jgi:hypothetical protein
VDGWAQLDRLGLLTQLGVIEGLPAAAVAGIGQEADR